MLRFRGQLDWCVSVGVWRAVFTHCGSEIVKGDTRKVTASVRALGSERGIEARGVHKPGRVPNPADFQEDRISAPHARLELPPSEWPSLSAMFPCALQ
jgi:hypothetical protein